MFGRWFGGFSASLPWAVGGDGVPSLAGVLRLHCHRLVYLRFLFVCRCRPVCTGFDGCNDGVLPPAGARSRCTLAILAPVG